MDEVELEDSGRGLICKDPINMGNALFQLPLKLVIDKEKALEVRLPAFACVCLCLSVCRGGSSTAYSAIQLPACSPSAFA